jgi:hypothetical protein
MATKLRLQLSEGKGLAKALVFHGLDFNVVVHPTIHGEPILTSQAFYYLDEMESVAEIRFENSQKVLEVHELEYIVDNYLFKYSALTTDSKISTKVTDPKYWKDDGAGMYMRYDQGNTEVLVLDMANDESILSIESLDENDKAGFSDWCLVKNYSDEIIENYVSSMSDLVQKKILIKAVPTPERDGYFGKIRLLECSEGLLDYHQAQSIDHSFSPRDITPDKTEVVLKSQHENIFDVYVPVESIHLDKKFDPMLLSYYFSGLKEINPLISFVGFYNVLEYYFEEAPKIIERRAKNEKQQLECVVSWLVNDENITDFFNEKGVDYQFKANKNIETSTEVDIQGFDFKSSEKSKNLSLWMYSVRCAIVHSKKSRNGAVTAIFKPYSEEADNILHVIPVVKWLAVLCIEKDSDRSGNYL